MRRDPKCNVICHNSRIETADKQFAQRFLFVNHRLDVKLTARTVQFYTSDAVAYAFLAFHESPIPVTIL